MGYDRARHLKFQKKKYRERRAWMISVLGGKCCVCGTNRNLEIHHKDRAKKSFELGERWSMPLRVLLAELRKCELRCRKHHLEKHKSVHGSPGMYRHQKCRCSVCRAGNAKRMTYYRRRIAQLEEQRTLNA
jgi:hypothetical protein